MLAGRFDVPAIVGPVTLAEALAPENAYLLDRHADQRLADLNGPQDLVLAVGPEGGWSESEVELARGRVLRLGRRNMRAETAAVAAVAVALAARAD